MGASVGKTRVTPPAYAPLSIGDAKAYLRDVDASEDPIIEALIASGVEWAEEYTRRAFITQTWDEVFDNFADSMTLHRSPLQSVTSVSYIDEAGATQVLATSVYTVDTTSTPGRITRAHNQTWPSVQSVPGAVTIRYVAGYVSADSPPVDAVPAAISLALRQWVQAMYDDRSGASVPQRVYDLLGPYRVLCV